MFSGNEPNETKDIPVREQALKAVKYAIETCFIGASNKRDDVVRTGGFSVFLRARSQQRVFFSKQLQDEEKCPVPHYKARFDSETKKFVYSSSRWKYFPKKMVDGIALFFKQLGSGNPMIDPLFNLNSNQIDMLYQARWASEIRAGNCGDRCAVIAEVVWKLWEKGSNIHRIELCLAATFDHDIVVFNREGNNLHDASTWGNAWIADAWFGTKGLVFPAHEFKSKMQKIKKYAHEEALALKKLMISIPPVDLETEETLTEAYVEICPAKHRYPVYSKESLKSYHDVDLFPEGTSYKDVHQTFFSEHKTKFQATLEKIAPKQSISTVTKAQS